MRRMAAVIGIILGGVMFASSSFALEAASGTPMSKTEPLVSGTQCVECHESEAKTHVQHGDCASCHTGADAHSKAEKPKAVNPGKPESAQCLSCHKTDKRRMHFSIAEHNKAGIKCSDCHGIHSSKIKNLNAGQEKGGATTALCATCHQDVVAKFTLRSHHPVEEGGVTCTGCHDPHSAGQAQLGGKTAQCTKCHQAVRGPFPFEHPPVVEDCTTCHDPHGAPNLRLQSVAQPMQCLQCHSLPNRRHGQTGSTSTNPANIRNEPVSGAVLRNCIGCHAAVHGSATDQHLRH